MGAAAPLNHGTGVKVIVPSAESTAYVPWFGTTTTGREVPEIGSTRWTEAGTRVAAVPGWSLARVWRVTGWFCNVVAASEAATGGAPTTTEIVEVVVVPLLSATR